MDTMMPTQLLVQRQGVFITEVGDGGDTRRRLPNALCAWVKARRPEGRRRLPPFVCLSDSVSR
jgi:hypothetical protein